MATRHADDDREKDDTTRDSGRQDEPTGAVSGADGRADPEQEQSESEKKLLSRRSALKVAGIGSLAGLASPLLSDQADAATVYDAVDDLGWDPNGNEPVQDSLEQAYGSNVTIQVPPGD